MLLYFHSSLTLLGASFSVPRERLQAPKVGR